jgi:hypothetical protein
MSQLCPSPKFTATYIDADGYVKPLVGGKLYSYVALSSTPKDTYTDYTLGSANTNPVILDVNGQADVWLNGSHKLILTDADDVTMWTVDSVSDLTQDQTFTDSTLAGTLTITSTAVTWSGNPTHSGNHTFTNNVVINGNSTLGDSGADSLTVNPNAVTWAGNPTHSGNHTFSGTTTMTGTLAVSGNVTLGDAITDTVAIAGPATITGGSTFGNAERSGTTVLDWYEENTFTPILRFGASSTGITYSVQLGHFTRIGNTVFFSIHILLSNKGSATTAADIVGLPYTSNSTASRYWNCAARAASMSTLVDGVMGTILNNSTTINLIQGAASGSTTITDTNFTNTSEIIMSGFYQT